MDTDSREGRFEQSEHVGTIKRVHGRWRASTDGKAFDSDSLVGACIAATGNTTSIVLTDVRLSSAELDASAACGVPFVAADTWIHNSHLLPGEPGSVTEDPEFEIVAHINGPAAGSEDGTGDGNLTSSAGTTTYFEVGRLGHLYFELDLGPVEWTFIGWFDNPVAAAKESASSGEGLSVTWLT